MAGRPRSGFREILASKIDLSSSSDVRQWCAVLQEDEEIISHPDYEGEILWTSKEVIKNDIVYSHQHFLSKEFVWEVNFSHFLQALESECKNVVTIRPKKIVSRYRSKKS